MTFKVVILGTASAMPTKERNLASAAIRYDGQVDLLDCPEGTQQQLMRSSLSLMKIKNILITHWHLDHWHGIYGLIATMMLQERKTPLTIYGPPPKYAETKQFLEIIRRKNTGFPLELKEITKAGKLYSEKEITVSAVKLNHSIPAYGYVFTETKPPKFSRKKALALGVEEGPAFGKLQKGKTITVKGKKIKPEQVYIGGPKVKKVAYFTDSTPYQPAFNKIHDADLLIHETTFIQADHERAKETKHSTAEKVAKMAKLAKVKYLVGTHFSARYKDLKHLEQELLKFHRKSSIAKEFDEYDV